MIRLSNVRVNNLKNVDLEIPAGQLLLFCGLSGSGKSSLALDTLYAEGQRRYIECLSPRTRQYIANWDKPDADTIDGVPPAIAVQALRGNLDRRAMLGTVTQVVDYLRLLFAEVAKPFCLQCDQPIESSDPESTAARLIDIPPGVRLQIAFRAPVENDWGQSAKMLLQQGWSRVVVEGRTIDLNQSDARESLDSKALVNEILVVVDRLKTGNLELVRTTESLEIAFQAGQGSGVVLIENKPVDGLPADASRIRTVDQVDWRELSYSSSNRCSGCDFVVPSASPQLFNHRQSTGVCETCDGVGFSDKLDRDRCKACKGTRLSPAALAYRVPLGANDSDTSPDWMNFGQLLDLRIDEVIEQMARLQISQTLESSLGWQRQEIQARLDYLSLVGLGYLTLSRSMRTLSAGEAQRAALTGCLSSSLVNGLYVLDEPSVGLHVHDIDRLMQAIRMLHQRDNTVVLVDHRESVIRAVDRDCRGRAWRWCRGWQHRV